MAPALVEQLAADPSRLVLGGEERDITILFADVRGFTRLSEGMNAQVLTQFVIELFSPLSQTIMNTGGTIDKYIGDSVMAFWNAPLDQPDHGARACRAALGMLGDLKALNERLRAVAERDGRPFRPVSLGIGINSGNCCVGNFGSAQRFDYSALGDDVNLASRLEGLTKMYGLPIVIGERTARAVPDLAVMEVDLMRVRGYQRAVRIFTVLGDEAHRRSDGFERLAETVAAMLAAYRSRRFDDAKALLQGLATEAPELKTLWSLYETRLASYAVVPPPETWDGSEDDKG
jgi:adenylate cyclase